MTLSNKQELLNKLKKENVIQYPLDYFRSWDIKTVRKPFHKNIDRILHELYSEYLNDNSKIVNVPNEENEYSFLNYLNTNFSGFAAIVNWINRVIIKSAKQDRLIATKQLKFEEDRSNWSEETKSMIIFMDRYKHQMFLPETNLYKTIKKIISKTRYSGNKSEKKILNFIKSVFPKAKNFKLGGDGNWGDMKKGIDISFELYNKFITVQNKKCQEVNERKYYYFVDGVSGIKNYKVHILSFEDKNGKLYLFKNKNVKINDNIHGKHFVIPKDNLISKS